MINVFKLLRIEQWVKNCFVFIPVFFAGLFFEDGKIIKSIIAFISFCFIASSIYIINDLFDIKKDENHPIKRFRPLASGQISKKMAILISLILFSLSLILVLKFGNINSLIILLVYYFMNIGYSLGLKNVPIIDILIISFGFLIRLLFGGFMTDIPITDWTLLLVFDLALILALGKRRGEYLNKNITGETRKSLEGYNKLFLDSSIILFSTVSIVSYIMFVLSSEIQERTHHNVIFTFLFVFASILRYLQLTFVYEKQNRLRNWFMKIDFYR